MNHEIIRRLAAATDATIIKWGGSQLFLIPFLYWALFRSLCMIPKKRRPDVIYLGDALLAPLGLLLKFILRRPVVVTAHGRDLTFRFPLYRTKVGFSLRRLDKIIGVSRYTTELCLAMGVSAERCVTIHNGVNPAEHIPTPEDIEAAREWLKTQGIEADRPIIMTVGRLVKRKGVARFITDILPLLTVSFPKLLYIVVGDGKERRSIEKAIAEHNLGGNVILTGQLPDPLIRGLMGLSKVFVMPNIHVPGDVEGFGIAAIEASCAGLPVVASGIEGILDAVVEGQNGALVQPGEPKRFAAAVNALLADEKLRRDAGDRAGKFTAEHFGWDTAAERYLRELQFLTKSERE